MGEEQGGQVNDLIDALNNCLLFFFLPTLWAEGVPKYTPMLLDSCKLSGPLVATASCRPGAKKGILITNKYFLVFYLVCIVQCSNNSYSKTF